MRKNNNNNSEQACLHNNLTDFRSNVFSTCALFYVHGLVQVILFLLKKLILLNAGYWKYICIEHGEILLEGVCLKSVFIIKTVPHCSTHIASG